MRLGIKRIARELGCSHHTVKHDVAAGGVKPFKSPQRPAARWARGLAARAVHPAPRHCGCRSPGAGCREGLGGQPAHLQRAVQPYRQALKAEALATVRFETAPGQQLQIDFGERLVEIEGRQVKAFVSAPPPSAPPPAARWGQFLLTRRGQFRMAFDRVDPPRA